MSKEITTLLSEYFTLKRAAVDLKEQRRAISIEYGSCDGLGEGMPCYMEERIEVDEYCDVCKARQPLSKQIQANGHRRVAIMNSLRSKVSKEPKS